jgi:ATP-binding cassette subfamily F protein uup
MRRQPKARTTKSKSRIEDFKQIKEKSKHRREEHEVQLEINMERMGTKVLEMFQVGKSFDDKIILDSFNYMFQRQDRIGIIGKNGTGKSTFLNLLVGSLLPDRGKIIRGETLKFGYYTQTGIQAIEGQKVIEVIREYGDFIPLTKGRKISAQQLLERFLFDRKKQYDFVDKLSGGELKRLYLCTILIKNPNFLILDEPTNDLDIVTLNVLENFLMDFPGCLIVASHDRYFMDKIVDHLFVFNGEGKVDNFPGNYSDYRAYEQSSIPPKQELDISKTSKIEWKKKTPSKTLLNYQEQKEFKKLEREIELLEVSKKNIQNHFAITTLSPDKIVELSKELSQLTLLLEEKTLRWITLSISTE